MVMVYTGGYYVKISIGKSLPGNIAIDVNGNNMNCEDVARRVVEDIKASEKVDEKSKIFYPNEMSYPTREDNIKNGIPINENIWETIKSL